MLSAVRSARWELPWGLHDLHAAAEPVPPCPLILALPSWDDYLGIALDEIISMAGFAQVQRRTERLLANLARIAPPRRLLAIETRLGRVRASVGASAG